LAALQLGDSVVFVLFNFFAFGFSRFLGTQRVTCLLCCQVAYQPVPVQTSPVTRPACVTSVQQLSVSGSKFQYVRLVSTTAPTQHTTRTAGPPGTSCRIIYFLLLSSR